MAETLCAADGDEGMDYCEVEKVKCTQIRDSVMHLTLEMSHISVTYKTDETTHSPFTAFATYFKYPEHEEVFVFIPSIEKEITLKHLSLIKEISKIIPKE
ncbi:hypothetical protein NO559_12140 [Dasania sp. GY-MA-18]|uniref:Uncharacterized protein n=1 Tax=Dasania phycosphaerae TaxID=2950436 RepID=A0A9J6RPB0_9GAMM|nr:MULTISPECIES: hypothetical protein [Dasania]MCR8923525.1 hypothetical protein [Dasania sp. GY-MA-18]MCZ0865959.1 hypothetical protein [Dasania phycosphaerae]MCZ0869683.1 hypothetical protein [Dasania phycosphaerae]